jgi:hypothetical protein
MVRELTLCGSPKLIQVSSTSVLVSTIVIWLVAIRLDEKMAKQFNARSWVSHNEWPVMAALETVLVMSSLSDGMVSDSLR